MADELKTIKENLFKVLTGLGASGRAQPRSQDDDDSLEGDGVLDAGAARALITAIFARAGKGKDEVIQIVAREIGMAVAHMLKEPLSQLAKNQKLQISFEFVPKDGTEGEITEKRPKKRAFRTTAVAQKRSSKRPKGDRSG